MTRPKPGRFPPLELVCIDYAGLVWATPKQYPDVPALDVGYVVRTRGRWAYETTESGRSRDTYPDAQLAAASLFRYLEGGARNNQEGGGANA